MGKIISGKKISSQKMNLFPLTMLRKVLKDYILRLPTKVPHGFRFALGMSDNTPPDADFGRVEMVAEILKEYSGWFFDSGKFIRVVASKEECANI